MSPRSDKPLPYDPDELHAKHQAWRDRINAIEDEIAELEAMEPEDETPTTEIEDNGGGSEGENGGLE